MIRRYDITTSNDTLDVEKSDWLRTHLNREQYSILNEGFLIDSYVLRFNDPAAETLYVLRWS